MKCGKGNGFAVNHPGVLAGLGFIHANGHKWIAVDDVAKAAQMSRRALHKAFVNKLGATPGEVLRNARVERAKRLLAETDYKLETVARMSGYQAACSFGLAFEKLTSMMPGEFRRAALL